MTALSEAAFPTLLLVENDPREAELLVTMLHADFRLQIAPTAERAIGMLEAEDFDLILADQTLPDRAGAQFLAEARLVRPRALRVIMSAPGEASPLLASIDRGDVHRFVKKPVTVEALMAAAERFRSDTAHKVRIGVILDHDAERGAALAQELAATNELLCTPQTELEARQRPAVVIVVDPPSPRMVDTTLERLGGRNRRGALFVALTMEPGADATPFLATGVDDVLWLPLRPDEVLMRYRTWRGRRRMIEEAERVRQDLLSTEPLPNLVGRSEPMRQVFAAVHRVAPTDTSVLLLGETGTGKEMIARALHALSMRRAGPFVPVNLGALPESLIESELFGHETGAFTGAVARRQGRFEIADGGTLFLDEIGDLAPQVQVKLLRVLEERAFERLGSNKPLPVDFRLVCATNRDLEELVGRGDFREDLYYRINVVRIDLPPLRERSGDVPRLAEHFLARFCDRANKTVTLGDEAMQALSHQPWHGNVRELEHVVERAVAMSRDGDVIGPELAVGRRPDRRSFQREVGDFFESGRGLREVLADVERTILAETLQRFDGNQVAAARKLKIPRQTLQHRLRKLGL